MTKTEMLTRLAKAKESVEALNYDVFSITINDTSIHIYVANPRDIPEGTEEVCRVETTIRIECTKPGIRYIYTDVNP